jgi:hypothetical protein
LVAKLPETNVQFAPPPDNALSVRQTPPPAAPTQTVHLVWLHAGSMASAVTRPEVVYAAPLKVNIAGKFAVLGPASVQADVVFLLFCDFIFAHAFCAFTVNRNGTSVAGYARFE